MFTKSLVTLLTSALVVSTALAHDTWLQTNTLAVRPGDAVHVDLMLGNHGNEHRDFKVAGKAPLATSTVLVLDPDGKPYDLKPSAVDNGYTAKDGSWSFRFVPEKPGLYLVAQTSDRVVDYAPKRSVHSAKTFFMASKSLDKVPVGSPGFDRILGHPLEIVPLNNPISPMGPGVGLRVRILYKGKPLANHTVSFIPRGHTLSPGFDPAFERKTDNDGVAMLQLHEATYYLVATHHEDPDGKGEGYDSTKYAATLTVLVPALCACCSD